jgi:4-amino-4-deoxy-L-arabinose transferase-like glycosyltransferase
VSFTKAKGCPGNRWDVDRLVNLAPLLFLVLAFLFWGGRTLWDTSEARYGQAAFEMLHFGHWLVPSLAAEPHLTKPPLTYWLIGAGMKIFGVDAWGARFFLSLAFLATIMAVRELASTLGFDRRQASVAALIYATGAIPFAGGHTLTTDGFLVLWETLGMLAAWKVWCGEPARRPLWRLVFWVSFGLAFLTKGPPGWLPFLVIAVFLRARRKADRPRLASIAGIGAFLIVSLWWYVTMVWQNPHLFSYFMVGEVYDRIFTTVHHRVEPFWYYLPILGAGVGPWLMLWPWLGKRVWRSLADKGHHLADWQLFSLLWVVISLVIFTLSKSKMVFYVLPLFVPLSLGLARVFTDDFLPLALRISFWRHFGWGIALLWAVVLVVYTGGLDFLAPNRSMRPAAEVFARATAKLPQKPQIYWVWAGRQRYSLSFYMQQVIRDADEPAAEGARETVPAGGKPSLYVTEEKDLRAAEHNGRKEFPGGAPYVLARAQGYVLFAQKNPEQATGRRTGFALAGEKR